MGLLIKQSFISGLLHESAAALFLRFKVVRGGIEYLLCFARWRGKAEEILNFALPDWIFCDNLVRKLYVQSKRAALHS